MELAQTVSLRRVLDGLSVAYAFLPHSFTVSSLPDFFLDGQCPLQHTHNSFSGFLNLSMRFRAELSGWGCTYLNVAEYVSPDTFHA